MQNTSLPHSILWSRTCPCGCPIFQLDQFFCRNSTVSCRVFSSPTPDSSRCSNGPSDCVHHHHSSTQPNIIVIHSVTSRWSLTGNERQQNIATVTSRPTILSSFSVHNCSLQHKLQYFHHSLSFPATESYRPCSSIGRAARGLTWIGIRRRI